MKRSNTAIQKLHEARRSEAIGGPVNDWEAGRLEAQAEAALIIDESTLVMSHGEAVLTDLADVSTRHWSFVETLKKPNLIAVEASEHRLNRVQDAGVLDLAIDAVESVQANSSVEKMLIHQMALAHDTAMRMLPKAMEERDPVNMTRYANAAARLMDIYREGLVALHRIKAGGRQTVTVQHVHVADGGQAIVGAVSGTGGTTKGGG